MKKLATALWQDECGMIVSAELVLVGTLGVLGMVTGLSHVRGAVVEEYKEFGDSLRSINQSYSYSGFSGCKAYTAGSAYLEDCAEPVIHFETIYEGETVPCQDGCPPTDEVIIEGQIQPTPCHGCGSHRTIRQDCCPTHRHSHGHRQELLVPLPSPEAVPHRELEAESDESDTTACLENFGPAPKYTSTEYPAQPLCYDHPESVYNIRRYNDTLYQPIAPYLTPRSTVW